MNLEYFQSKFDTLYLQNNTKRKDIAAKTGIIGEKITKLRNHNHNPKNVTRPTVDDLIAISDYYHVTVDELLRPQEEAEQINDQEESFDSLGDIVKILFKIDHSIGIDLNTELNDNSLPLYILNPKIQDLIKEWTIIKDNLTSIESCGSELIALWEQDKIKTYKEYIKERDFIRDSHEQIAYVQHLDYLANKLIDYSKSDFMTDMFQQCPLSSNEIKSVLKYANFPDISQDKKQAILNAFELCKDQDLNVLIHTDQYQIS